MVVLSLTALGGLLASVHVSILAGLLARPPRWWAAVALLIPPVAPLLGARAGLVRRAIAWGVLAAAYLAVQAFFPG
jgi:apolipoprotein N-acyltransferase